MVREICFHPQAYFWNIMLVSMRANLVSGILYVSFCEHLCECLCIIRCHFQCLDDANIPLLRP